MTSMRRTCGGEACSYCPVDLRLDGLRCGICRSFGDGVSGSGARRSQHWDRLRVSRLRRSANLRATCLLRPAPSLLQSTLCRLWPLTAAIPASLSPGTTLSPLLLLLLIRPRLHKFRENRCEGKTDPAGCQPLNIRSVLRQHVPRGLSLGHRRDTQ